MMSHCAFCSSRHRTMSARFFCTLCSSSLSSLFCSFRSETVLSRTCTKSASSFSTRAACCARGANVSACCACASRSSAIFADQVRRCAISRSAASKASACCSSCRSAPRSPASSSAVRSPRLARLRRSSCSRWPLELRRSLTALLVLSLRAFACWQVFCISACFSFNSLQTLPCLSSLFSRVPFILCSRSGKPCSRVSMRPLPFASDA
mmetsp:Transcript_106924/g.319713  ORF Transcript_106924/g.319713 Transcript_106924/m.319713 type:complete len:208 (+) Transcript_106924:480-1103(+)